MTMNSAEDLHDRVLEDEIELLAGVLEAVAEVDHPLPEPELDRALGLSRAPEVRPPS